MLNHTAIKRVTSALVFGVAISTFPLCAWAGSSTLTLLGNEHYFPKNTAYFAEIVPKHSTIERSHRQVRKTIMTMAQELAPEHVQEADQAVSSTLQFIDTWLTQSVSIGFWFDKVSAPAAATSPKPVVKKTAPAKTQKTSAAALQKAPVKLTVEPRVLVILPIKPEQDPVAFRQALLDIIAASGKPLQEVNDKGFHYFRFQGKNSPAIVIEEQNLMIADSPKTLAKARTEKDSPESMADNSVFQRYAAVLPTEREGTLLVSSQDLSVTTMMFKMVSEVVKSPKHKSQMLQLSKFFENYMKPFPGTLASLHFDDAHSLVQARVFTPVEWDTLPEDGFRADLMAVFEANNSLKTILAMLPPNTAFVYQIANLDRYYDLFANHALTEANRASWSASLEKMLSPFALDFRRNIVGLLGPQFAVAATLNPKPDGIAVLSRSEDTQTTLNKLMAVVALTDGIKLESTARDSGEILHVFRQSGHSKGLSAALTAVNEKLYAVGTEAALVDMDERLNDRTLTLLDAPDFRAMATLVPDNALWFMYLSNTEVVHGLQNWFKPSSAKPSEGSPQESVPEASPDEVPSEAPSISSNNKKFTLVSSVESDLIASSPLGQINGSKDKLSKIAKSAPPGFNKAMSEVLGLVKSMSFSAEYNAQQNMILSHVLIQMAPEAEEQR